MDCASLLPQRIAATTRWADDPLADVVAVFAANRLLESGTVRAVRARLLTRLSGTTMVGLGAYLALARREA